MRRQASLIALAVAAVLVAVLVWLDQRRPSTEEASRQRQHLLPGFDRARATEISIERGGVTTTLRHEASGWWIAGPPRRRAADDEIESLLGVLEYAEIDRRITHVDAALRKKLGLEPPRDVVHVQGHTLRIGGDDPSHDVYVLRDDEPDVLVTDHRLVGTADLDPRLWMSMSATVRDPSTAKKIEIGGRDGAERVVLERDHGWRVTRPAVARANDAAVDALVQQLVRARAVDTADKPLLGCFGKPAAIYLDGERQASVCGTRVWRADGAELDFRATDLNDVGAPAEHYYERRLFPFRLDDIVAVDVGPLALRRESAAWRIVAPLSAVRPVADEKVRAFVEPLLAAQASSFSTAPRPVASTAGAHATRVRLATRDEEIVAAVNGSEATRAGETVTLELAAPLSLATSF